jgi:glycosyltransferase 2 family protein
MTRKGWIVSLGTIFSIVLVIILLMKLDWRTFWISMQSVSWSWLVFAGFITVCGTLLRALRWILIAGLSLNHYRFFCHATSFGYLGNAIFPARAGEALRMLSIARSTPLPMPKAVTSAVIDRVADLAMLGVVTLLVVAHHGFGLLSGEALVGITGLVTIPIIGMVLFTLKGAGYQPLVEAFSQRLPARIGSRLPNWYLQAHDGLWPLRSGWRMTGVLSINTVTFLLDCITMWMVIIAFGWSLPFWAAVTVGVFIAAGTSLPSAPGYVGVYQVACILALGLYGIDGASAVAYAIVLQLLNLIVTVLLSTLSLLDGRFVALRKT